MRQDPGAYPYWNEAYLTPRVRGGDSRLRFKTNEYEEFEDIHELSKTSSTRRHYNRAVLINIRRTCSPPKADNGIEKFRHSLGKSRYCACTDVLGDAQSYMYLHGSDGNSYLFF